MAVVVPGAAHLLPSADVRNRIDHAAIEQADIAHRKIRIHRQAVAAIGVLQHRRAAVLPETLAIGHRHRNPGAVARRRPQPLGRVILGVVAAQHRLALEQLALAAAGVHFIGRVGRGQRGVGVAQPLGVRLGVGAQAHGVGRLVGGHEAALAFALQYPQAKQAAGALLDGDEAGEQFELLDVDIGRVRDQIDPLAAIAQPRIVRQGLQPEVGRLLVAAEHPAAVEMIGLVFDIALARRDHGELARARPPACSALRC